MPDYNNMMGFRPLVDTGMGQEAAQQQIAQQQQMAQMAAQQQQMAQQQQFPSEVLAVYQGLVNVAQEGSTADLAAYVRENNRDLRQIRAMYPNEPRFDFLGRTLDMFSGAPEEMVVPQGRRDGGIMAIRRY